MSTSSPVRVLYCENNVDGTIGGSHHCLLNLVSGLDRTRFDPTVVFYQAHALVPRFEAVAATRIVEPLALGVRRAQRALPRAVAGKLGTVARFVRMVRQRMTFMRTHGTQLLCLNNSVTRHHDWMLAARLAGIPCIVHERGLNARYGWLDRFFASRLALLVPMSLWVRDHMVARGVSPRNVRVLYDGLDPESVRPTRSEQALRQAYGIEASQPVIGIVGNVREWKGQEVVVRALGDVVRRWPDVVCFFVGAATEADRAYQAKLDALIDEAGIAGNVRFTGYQQDPASFMQLMRFVVHASIQPEPFGMVVLEAMALRRAVIGSRAGGPVEIVEDGETGYTFAPGNSAELAGRISLLLEDPPLAVRMGERGYRRLRDAFTLDHYVGQMQSAYDAILAGRPVSPDFGLRAPCA